MGCNYVGLVDSRSERLILPLWQPLAIKMGSAPAIMTHSPPIPIHQCSQNIIKQSRFIRQKSSALTVISLNAGTDLAVCIYLVKAWLWAQREPSWGKRNNTLLNQCNYFQQTGEDDCYTQASSLSCSWQTESCVIVSWFGWNNQSVFTLFEEFFCNWDLCQNGFSEEHLSIAYISASQNRLSDADCDCTFYYSSRTHQL